MMGMLRETFVEHLELLKKKKRTEEIAQPIGIYFGIGLFVTGIDSGRIILY
jgi:hypothetical protein